MFKEHQITKNLIEFTLIGFLRVQTTNARGSQANRS